MIELAVFDLDGTLVNSIYDLADAVNNALADNGYPTHELEAYKHFVGNGAKKLIERALPAGTDRQECSRIHGEYTKYYRAHCLDKTLPYDGMPELVARLRAEGIKCAVASNKPDEFSKEIVTALFGSDGFDLVRGKLEGAASKPAPDILYGIAKTLGTGIEKAVMIGDSNVDVQTAHNAGIKCIGCTWGFRGRAELEAEGADFIAETAQDIADIIIR